MVGVRVLHWDFSPLFDRFREGLSLKDLPVEFDYTSNHPQGYLRVNRHGVASANGASILVWLRGNLPLEVAEETAAHEIMHLELVNRGFPTVHVRDGNPDIPWNEVAVALGSWTSDLIIDQHLNTIGYPLRQYQGTLFRDTIQSLKISPGESDYLHSVALNSLGFFLPLLRRHW